MSLVNIKKDGNWVGQPVLGFKVGEDNLTNELKEKIDNNSNVELDDSLTQSGKAADAKAVGEKFENLTAEDVGAVSRNNYLMGQSISSGQNILELPNGLYEFETEVTEELKNQMNLPVISWHYSIIVTSGYDHDDSVTGTNIYKSVVVLTSDGDMFKNYCSWATWKGWQKVLDSRTSASDIGAAPAGYGLGDATTEYTDLNNATSCGWFAFTKDNLNRPFDYGVVMVMNRYGNQVTQIAFNPNMAGCGEMCVRHFYSDTWTLWEYINPPMNSGVEYRTTERFLGKPVYVRCVVYGYIAAGTTTFAHGISGIDNVVGLDVVNNTYGYFSNSDAVHSAADRTNITIVSNWAMGGLIYTIKYTKV